MIFRRAFAKQRMTRLCSSLPMEGSLLDQVQWSETDEKLSQLPSFLHHIQQVLKFAGLAIPLPLLFLISLASGFCISSLASSIIAWPALPLIFLLGSYCPWIYIDWKAESRALEFSNDYPELLQSMSSALKSGHSAQTALEHASKLLPEDNPVGQEVKTLLSELHKGTHQQKAVAAFAADRDVPELSLFRNAFLLVLDDGGKFSPTLQRLARISRERDNLKNSVKVSTATMKITGNILLLVCPLVVLMVSARSENFWSELSNNTLSSGIFSTGVILVFFGYFSLRNMGRYKP